MARQITYGEESREALFRGIDSLANAVRVTLGPKGRNVILGKTFGAPTITKDGVTVAREITLKDPNEMKEKKARVEDAMHATKAAVEEGIVAGRVGRVAVADDRSRSLAARKLTVREVLSMSSVVVIADWIKRVADDERKRDAMRLAEAEEVARKADLVRLHGRRLVDELQAAIRRDVESFRNEF